MSVIQEALRKAQKENESMSVLPLLQTKGSNQGARTGRFVPRRLLGIVLAGLFVSAGVGGAVVLHDRFMGAEPPKENRRLVKAVPASPASEPAASPVRREAPRSTAAASVPMMPNPARKPYRPDRNAPDIRESLPVAVAKAGPVGPPAPSNPEPEAQKPAGRTAKTTASNPSMEKAERMLRDGDLQGAESVLSALIGKDPEHIEAIVALANLYFREMEAPERAYPLYQRVLNLDPNRSAAHVNLGVYFLRKGDPARARQYTKRALELVPDLAEAHYNLACIEALAGNRTEAERALKRATMIDPRCAQWAKEDPDLVLLRRQGYAARSTLP